MSKVTVREVKKEVESIRAIALGVVADELLRRERNGEISGYESWDSLFIDFWDMVETVRKPVTDYLLRRFTTTQGNEPIVNEDGATWLKKK